MKKTARQKKTVVLFRNPKIEVRESKIHGFGVFANADIDKDEMLEEVPIIKVSMPWDNVPGILQNYVFDAHDKKDKNKFIIAFGVGSVYNHSAKYNATHYTEKNTFQYYASKRIKKDEEIFISYGKNYWTTRDIKLK